MLELIEAISSELYLLSESAGETDHCHGIIEHNLLLVLRWQLLDSMLVREFTSSFAVM